MNKKLSFSRSSLFLLRILLITVIIPFTFVCFLLQFDWVEREGKTFANFTFIHKWDWIAIIFSFSSLCTSILTYLSQKQTESNTVKNITPQIQQRLLERLIPRLYMNYIISISIELKCSSDNFNSFPSEEHMYKMQIPLDLIHQELFYNNPSHFDIIYDIKKMIEIYNKEIQLVWNHLMSTNISQEAKEKDIENILIQKPGTLAWKISNHIRKVWTDSSFDAASAICCIKSENEVDMPNIHIPENYLKKSKFMKFFSDEIERGSFIRKVKSDVSTAMSNPDTIILIPLSSHSNYR